MSMLFWKAQTKKTSASHVHVNGDGITSGTAGESCKFSIFCAANERLQANHCSVAFEGPSKPEIRFSTESDGLVECIWKPSLPGIYKVYVRYNNEEVPGSPFSCTISGGEHLHRNLLSKICCRGAIHAGRLNGYNEVLIEEANAVIGGVSVSMEGPGKPDIQFRNDPDALAVLYKCPVPGNYVLNVKFANVHVNGSPFRIKVH